MGEKIGFDLEDQGKEKKKKDKESTYDLSALEKIDEDLRKKAEEIAIFKTDDMIELVAEDPKAPFVKSGDFLFSAGTNGRVIQCYPELKGGNDIGKLFMTMVDSSKSEVEVNYYQVLLPINKKVAHIAKVHVKNLKATTKEEVEAKEAAEKEDEKD